jgi:hypothetical protein
VSLTDDYLHHHCQPPGKKTKRKNLAYQLFLLGTDSFSAHDAAVEALMKDCRIHLLSGYNRMQPEFEDALSMAMDTVYAGRS